MGGGASTLVVEKISAQKEYDEKELKSIFKDDFDEKLFDFLKDQEDDTILGSLLEIYIFFVEEIYTGPKDARRYTKGLSDYGLHRLERFLMVIEKDAKFLELKSFLKMKQGHANTILEYLKFREKKSIDDEMDNQ